MYEVAIACYICVHVLANYFKVYIPMIYNLPTLESL